MKASHIATWICIACCQVHAQYAVVISEATWNDPAWRQVAQSLKTKHNGSVFIYAGPPFPADLKENLSENQPTHVCFVAIPEEVTVALVRGCHQLLRDLDDDSYGDAIWGIVTGINADQAAHLVSKNGPLTIRTALLKTAGNYLNYLFSGQYHCEGGNPHELWTRIEGGTVIKGFDSESDDTVPFVNLLNSNAVDLFVTSGHASEYLWQLHHPTIAPEGHFYAVDGRLFGLDAGENSHSIETTNDKVYWAPGNCRIAHIPEDESRTRSMVLAWLGSGGAIQMAGYTVDTWFGYMGWGIADYFVYLQDRFTFAQSVFLNNQALLFDQSHDTPNVDPIGLNYDKDVFVLYGDPAYKATLQKVTEPLYDQFLAFTNVDGVVAYSLTIHMNSAVNIARPIIAYLPIKIREPRIIQRSGRLVDVVDDMVLVQVWRFGEQNLQKNQEWHIAFSGIANSKPENNHTADFLEPRWIIDGTEVNRVLAYWRDGAYHRDATGADGYAPSSGSTNGLRHSADYQPPYWSIDGAEISRVLAYWRAGAYHANPDGDDGFAPGLRTTEANATNAETQPR